MENLPPERQHKIFLLLLLIMVSFNQKMGKNVTIFLWISDHLIGCFDIVLQLGVVAL